MKRITVEVTETAASTTPTHRGVMDAPKVSRSELLVWGPVAGVTTLSWFDAGRDGVATLLDGVDPVGEYRLVDGDGGTYAFTDRPSMEFEASVLDLLAASGLVFPPPVTFFQTGAVRFEAVGDTDRLSRFYDALSADRTATIIGVSGFERTHAPAATTTRQAAALEAAVDVGYYDVPRTGSVADVAGELDCAHSTAGDLLRRAEATLIGDFVGEP